MASTLAGERWRVTIVVNAASAQHLDMTPVCGAEGGGALAGARVVGCAGPALGEVMAHALQELLALRPPRGGVADGSPPSRSSARRLAASATPSRGIGDRPGGLEGEVAVTCASLSTVARSLRADHAADPSGHELGDRLLRLPSCAYQLVAFGATR